MKSETAQIDRRLGRLEDAGVVAWDCPEALPLAEQIIVSDEATFHAALRTGLGFAPDFEFSQTTVYRVDGDNQLHIQSLVRSPGRGFFRVSCAAAPFAPGDPLPVGLSSQRKRQAA